MRIPTDITPLEYIAGSGSQYIETAIHLLSTDVVKSKWRFQNSAGNVYGCFTSSGASDNFCLYAGSASTNAYIRYDGQVVRDFKAVSGTVYEIEHGPDGFFANGSKEADFDAASFTCSAPMYIFMLPNSSSAKVTARCYGLQVIRGGEVAYDFIPARNEATGEVGMWEAVHGAWYGNDGTGAFTAGSAVARVLGTTHDGWRRRLMMAASKHYEIVPGSDGYNWIYYDTSTANEQIRLMYYAGTIVNSELIVDGVSYTITQSGNQRVNWTFATPGRHLVKYKETNSSGFARFEDCAKMVEAYLNKMLTTDGRLFNRCTGLTTVSLPEDVTSLTVNMFNGCSSLVLNTKNVTTITGSCSGVLGWIMPKIITLPSGFLRVSRNNTVTTYVDIGPDCTTIGVTPFYNCTKLQTIICRAVAPPTAASPFYGLSTDYKFYVPYSADHSILNAYKTTSGWSAAASRTYELNPDGTIPTA